MTITETEGSRSTISSLALTGGTVSTGTYQLTLQEGDGSGWTRTTTHDSTFSGGTRDDVVTVRSGGTGGTVVAKTKYHYVDELWGEEMTQMILDPDTAALTTSYAYYTTSSDFGNYTQVQSITYPTNNWVSYAYNNGSTARGLLAVETHPFGNPTGGAPSAAYTVGTSVTYDYQPDWSGAYTVPQNVKGYATPVSTTYQTSQSITAVTTGGSLNSQPYCTYQTDSYSDVSNSIRTTSEVINPGGTADFYDLPLSIKRPDQSQDSYAYYLGSYVSGTFTSGGSGAQFFRSIVWHGSTSSAGATSLSSYDGQSVRPINLIVNKSTMDIIIRDPAGNIVHKETQVCTGSGTFSPVSSEDFTHDVAGRVTDDLASNGAHTEYTYTDGVLTKMVDPTGIETDYSNYDPLGRALTVTTVGRTYTTFVYDAVGHATSATVHGSSGSETIVSSNFYDVAGRLTSSTSPGVSATTYSSNYSVSGQGWSTTATAPSPASGTTVKTYQIDGQLASVTGTGVVAQYYTYGVETDGRRYTQVNVGASSSPRYQKSWVDWLGRNIQSVAPGYSQTSQSDAYIKNTYDTTTGLLIKTRQTNSSNGDILAATIYSYDTLGALKESGQDIDADGSLGGSSTTDRITDVDTSFESISSNWWLNTTTQAYPFSSSTAKTMSIKRTRLTGFSSGVEAETKVTDAETNETDSVTTVNRSTKTVTTSTTAPGIANTQTVTSVNGLGTSTVGFDGLTDSVSYDALDRVSVKTDPRLNTTTLGYVNGATMVASVTSSTSTNAITVTNNHYDAAGRLDYTWDALSRYTYYEYTTLGKIHHVFGNATYPVEYNYDDTSGISTAYGDRTSMSTFRDGPSNPTSWPSGMTADTTKWHFDEATGLLYQKTDASNHSVTFDYNTLRQVSKRTLARGVYAEYHYSTLKTGELSQVSYSDSTPVVTYGPYSRLGQISSVDDAAGTRYFNYDTSLPWRLNYVALPGFYGSRWISEQYETGSNSSAAGFGTYTHTGTILGRQNGFLLGTSSGTHDQDLTQTYKFGTDGRFIGLTSVNTSASQDFVYSYYTASGHPSRLIDGYTAGSLTVSRVYQAPRDLLKTIQSKWGSTILTQYDYEYDSAFQRTAATQYSGANSAFADYTANLTSPSYNSVHNSYSYSDRGELQTSAMFQGDTLLSGALELPGRRFEYRYDSIGNRTLSGANGTADSIDDQYKTTATNGYDTRENNVIRVLGTSATSNLAVSQSLGVTKLDNAWTADLEPSNGGGPVNSTATIYAAYPGATDYVASTTKAYLVPPALQHFAYDNDGNLTGDEVWTYTYDAENRLVEMENPASAIDTTRIPASNARKFVFVYDYQGRRIEKITYAGYSTISGTYSGTASADVKFLYNGWDLICEIDASSGNITRSYTWGLDLSGGLSQAGGVGGLLQIYDYASGKTWWPTYDGNGNVASLVDASSGIIAAAYEYDPFGGTIRAEMIDSTLQTAPNSFTFSTRYSDPETGLLYYGLRYYNPSLGRFVNRDPIEEQGGLNLYGFCGNNGVGSTDVLGMDVWFDLNSWYQNFGGWDDTQRAKARLALNNGFHDYFNVPATGPGTRVPGLEGSVGDPGIEIDDTFNLTQWNPYPVNIGTEKNPVYVWRTFSGDGSSNLTDNYFGYGPTLSADAALTKARAQADGKPHDVVVDGHNYTVYPDGTIIRHLPAGDDIKITINENGSVTGFDPLMLASYSSPSTLTLARLASGVYDLDKGFLGVDGYYLLTSHSDKDTGLSDAVFTDGYTSVLVFAGTDPLSLRDWIANFSQGLGLTSAQYAEGLKDADIDYVEANGNLIFDGHSLGGGIASAAAVIEGGYGVTFNAAGVNDHTLSGVSRSNGTVVAYYSDLDVLHFVNLITPNSTSVIGQRISLGLAGWHPMAGIIAALQRTP